MLTAVIEQVRMITDMDSQFNAAALSIIANAACAKTSMAWMRNWRNRIHREQQFSSRDENSKQLCLHLVL